jgi:hypothetical protein
MKYKLGYKIKFKEEKQRYSITAFDGRYLVCVKPFNLRKTYLYTIVDLKEKIRGTDGLLCSLYDYRNRKHAKEYLKGLKHGLYKISSRNRIPLNIENVEVV